MMEIIKYKAALILIQKYQRSILKGKSLARKENSVFLLSTILLLTLSSCKKYLDVGPPRSDLTASTVFNSDNTATAAISSIYAQMAVQSSYSSGSTSSLTFLSALSADELDLYFNDQSFRDFSNNTVQSTNTLLNSLWNTSYQTIYRANSLVDGLTQASGVSSKLRTQLLAEAKFIRAFTHFYLVNIFGDIPYIETTDYRITGTIKRQSTSEVYEKIIQDLTESLRDIDPTYTYSNNERVRPNKYVVAGLLSRAYLFRQDWLNAESTATEVINNSNLYKLEPLDKVFLKGSKEAIWQLVRDNFNAYDALSFFMTGATPSTAALKKNLITTFEVSDGRAINWIGSKTTGSTTYYFAKKYKTLTSTPAMEHSIVIRLAEIYLIRAEARINQPGKLSSGIDDLNILRTRAMLSPLTQTLTKTQALDSLEIEKNHELFTEWGHRWLDLKRWPSKLFPGDNTVRRADDILQAIKAGWKKEWKLYPIPKTQIQNDPGMSNQQNPGYD